MEASDEWLDGCQIGTIDDSTSPIAMSTSFNTAERSNPNTYPLRNLAILDSGTTCHIFNDVDRFVALWPPRPGDFIWAGNTQVWIQGYGSVHVRLKSTRGNSTIRLDNVALCPDLLCNLVSFRLLRRQGLWWDTKSEPTAIKQAVDTVIAELQELYS